MKYEAPLFIKAELETKDIITASGDYVWHAGCAVQWYVALRQ